MEAASDDDLTQEMSPMGDDDDEVTAPMAHTSESTVLFAQDDEEAALSPSESTGATRTMEAAGGTTDRVDDEDEMLDEATVGCKAVEDEGRAGVELEDAARDGAEEREDQQVRAAPEEELADGHEDERGDEREDAREGEEQEAQRKEEPKEGDDGGACGGAGDAGDAGGAGGSALQRKDSSLAGKKRGRSESSDTIAPPGPADKKAKIPDSFEDNLTCDICQDLMHKPVSLMPCLHNFCACCYSKVSIYLSE